MENSVTKFTLLKEGMQFNNFKSYIRLFDQYIKNYDLKYVVKSTKYFAKDSKYKNKQYNPDLVYSEYHLRCKATRFDPDTRLEVDLRCPSEIKLVPRSANQILLLKLFTQAHNHPIQGIPDNATENSLARMELIQNVLAQVSSNLMKMNDTEFNITLDKLQSIINNNPEKETDLLQPAVDVVETILQTSVANNSKDDVKISDRADGDQSFLHLIDEDDDENDEEHHLSTKSSTDSKKASEENESNINQDNQSLTNQNEIVNMDDISDKHLVENVQHITDEANVKKNLHVNKKQSTDLNLVEPNNPPTVRQTRSMQKIFTNSSTTKKDIDEESIKRHFQKKKIVFKHENKSDKIKLMLGWLGTPDRAIPNILSKECVLTQDIIRKNNEKFIVTTLFNKIPSQDLQLLKNYINSDVYEMILTSLAQNEKNWQCQECENPSSFAREVVCDKCLTSYHTKCVNLRKLPQKDWYCKNCK